MHVQVRHASGLKVAPFWRIFPSNSQLSHKGQHAPWVGYVQGVTQGCLTHSTLSPWKLQESAKSWDEKPFKGLCYVQIFNKIKENQERFVLLQEYYNFVLFTRKNLNSYEKIPVLC